MLIMHILIVHFICVFHILIVHFICVFHIDVYVYRMEASMKRVLLIYNTPTDPVAGECVCDVQ